MKTKNLNFLKGKKLTYHFVVSFLLITVWVIIAKDQYSYNHNFPVIFGINLFPLLIWTVGLFFIYLLYCFFIQYLNQQSFIKNFLLFVTIGWVILIGGETIGYHLFNVKNLANAIYPGLPICYCMHAPPWMQLSYFFLAPIYFMVCYLLGLENNFRKSYK